MQSAGTDATRFAGITPSKAASAPAAERGAWQCAQPACKTGPSCCFLHLMQVALLLKATGEAWQAQEARDMGDHAVRGAMQAASSCLWSGSTQSDHF